MPISKEDIAFMEEVAQYYRNTEEINGQESSILATAIKFNISRNKVRKILVTTGDVEPMITSEVIALRNTGMSIKEIAADLGLSVATVSTALPYSDKFNNSLAPSHHTAAVRQYRAYERQQANRQVSMENDTDSQSGIPKGRSEMEEKEWQKDIKMSYTETYHRPHRITWADREQMCQEQIAQHNNEEDSLFQRLNEALQQHRGEYEYEEKEIRRLEGKQPLTEKERGHLSELKHRHGLYAGALNNRHTPTLEAIAGDRLPPEPTGIMRLHLEIYDSHDFDSTTETLKTIGGVKYGSSISRDVVAPYELPLYALHYVIQRAFGWQNSHLYEYVLPEEIIQPLTHNNASMWSCLVGVLFQSPLMDEEDEFWADDYEQGSFKNWLRKKYTGPYMSQCHGEGLYSCQSDMTDLDMEQEYYVLFVKAFDHKTKSYREEEFIENVQPVYDENGKKLMPPFNTFHEDAPSRVEILKFKALPTKALLRLFERNSLALLKRLPVYCVLLPGRDRLSDDEAEQEYIQENIAHTGAEVFNAVGKYVHNIIISGTDSPLVQVDPPAVTGTLFYRYDFGDGWTIKITASENCPDLVESGRITQAELDRANVKCRETFRPVLLARDGEMLMDDVGGIHGFTEFLEITNPDLSKMVDEDEIADAKQQKKEYLEWAKGMGWKRKDNSTNFNWL